jgi:hypothetical protein
MMPWQMAQQLKHELEQVKWTTGSAKVVFGTNNRVRVTSGEPTQEQMPGGFPFALVILAGGVPDEEDPDLLVQRFEVLTCVSVTGDPMGEAAVIGASADLGESAGRGIAEVAARVRAAIGKLTGADGAKVQVTITDISTPKVLAGPHVVIDERTVTVICTSDLHYAAPQEIAVTGEAWTWAGPHCSNRFDFKQYRLVWKTGTAAPTSPSDGTTVYTGTVAGTTHAPLAGKTYAAFADYSARKQSGVVEGSSDPEVGSYKVVA